MLCGPILFSYTELCLLFFIFSSNLIFHSLILVLYAHATQQNLILFLSLSHTHSFTNSLTSLVRILFQIWSDITLSFARYVFFSLAIFSSSSRSRDLLLSHSSLSLSTFHSFSLIFPFQSLLFSVTSPRCALSFVIFLLLVADRFVLLA